MNLMIQIGLTIGMVCNTISIILLIRNYIRQKDHIQFLSKLVLALSDDWIDRQGSNIVQFNSKKKT